MTRHCADAARPLHPARFARRIGTALVVGSVVFGLAGCSAGGQGGTSGSASKETSAPVGAHMAGAVVDVQVSPEAVADKPQKADLSTPEKAVRSYLDWTSYAYRIAQSEVAVDTMSTNEEVRVDSYVQYNIQKNQLLDQTLDSLVIGKVVDTGKKTLVPAKEKWTYRYVSIKSAGKTIGGPYNASYDTTYTVVKNDKGKWVVDSVDAKPLGEVK